MPRGKGCWSVKNRKREKKERALSFLGHSLFDYFPHSEIPQFSTFHQTLASFFGNPNQINYTASSSSSSLLISAGFDFSISDVIEMEKEAKKEAFRKYLESTGVLDALTKVLVALYEQNDKPSSPVEFVQQKLGGPTLSEYEKLRAELSDLQIKYNELSAVHQETCKELQELRNSQPPKAYEDTTDREIPRDYEEASTRSFHSMT